MSKLARLRRLSMREVILLSQLVLLCSVIAIALRITGWRQVSKTIVARSQSKWLRRFPVPHLSDAIENLATLTDMASRLFPRNRCLVRSMALLWLLRTRGESAKLVLGVRKRAGVFEAHAWTIAERGLIGDRPEVIAEFETLMTTEGPEQS